MPKSDWRPTASLVVLKKRAELLGQIRSFFAQAGVMEVDVPVLAATGVTDIHIDTIEARVKGEPRHLQSSPEYYMKRLLAAGAGSIYCLGKAFRDGEEGRRHHPEFTLLEWYRVGWDEHQLIAEIDRLFHDIQPTLTASRIIAYRELFESVLGVDPHAAQLSELQQLTVRACGENWRNESRATCLDVLFSLQVEPAMGTGLVVVTEYPACQSALARLDKNAQGQTVARRFEVFLNGMELGNGYFELTDAAEQQKRFDADIALRQASGKPVRDVDQKLMAALKHSLPDCAGVAIGVDRWLMQLAGASHINEVLPFGDL